MGRGKKAAARSSAAEGSAGKGPAAAPPLDLEKVRGQIDTIDEKIHALINDRARLAQLVGISKTREGKTVDFYRPEREAQVLRMARERNNGLCGTRRFCGCSARSCRPVSPSRSR